MKNKNLFLYDIFLLTRGIIIFLFYEYCPDFVELNMISPLNMLLKLTISFFSTCRR